MQVAKYWRNRKLRYRLKGYPRRAERIAALASFHRVDDRDKQRALKREPMKLPL